ncbi:MAG: metallophosphoesterase [Nanoarchaeota archaeon]|nr:metallophosphoesterase [Nanoarchaeota archaeon]
MKIVAVSDLHMPGKNDFNLFHALKDLPAEIDVLVLGGDIASSSELLSPSLQKLEKMLDDYNITVKHRVFVPGNHEIYKRKESQNPILKFLGFGKPDSVKVYEGLASIVADHGYHMLDEKPLVIDGVAFVGNIGWYDYSFRNNTDLEVVVNGRLKKLKDFKDSDYASKKAQDPKSGKTFVWPDKNTFNDKEFTDQCLEKLEQDLEQVKDYKNIIVVMHNVPFKQNLSRSGSPFIQFTTAYMGSERFGELIRKYPVRTVIHGHAHSGSGDYKVDGVDCHNVAFKRKIKIIDYSR